MRCFISVVVGRSPSPADLDGGALEILFFVVGLSLFQLAKHLSKAYLRVVVLKVIMASASNCLPIVFGYKISMVPDRASPLCLVRIFSISSACLVE